MSKVHNASLRLVELLLKMLPLKQQVMFTSFGGQYNDNPKYISQKLHEMHPEIKQVWIISDRCHEKELLPSYIETVPLDSFVSVFEKCRSKVIVDNGAGWCLVKSHNIIYRLLKKENQFNISTWHGSPIKRVGADSLDALGWTVENMFTTSDVIIAGCKYVKSVFESAFLKLIPVKLTGTPRNDVLFNQDKQLILQIKKKLGLNEKCKYVLIAPTYRNNPEDSGVNQLKMMKPNKLISVLENKFGGTWKIILRAHNVVLDKMNKSGVIDGNTIIDGNKFDDMAEYLIACDALITDFSGALFDNALTNKPCFLFAHDYKHYSESERGLYIDIDKLPYPFSENVDELYDSISQYDDKINEIKCKEFLDYIGNVEDGSASERLVRIIIQHL